MTAPRQPWADQAACLEIPGFTELQARTAVFTCLGCPVRQECLDDALRMEADDALLLIVYHAVRGGLSGGARSKLIAERRRAVAA